MGADDVRLVNAGDFQLLVPATREIECIAHDTLGGASRNSNWRDPTFGDLICLAGYMRLLSPCFVEAFRGRILNIHPSLLPSFPGLDAQRQALEHRVKFSGCTVHFVDESLDGGPIIAQRVVPVLEGDSVESLSARILEQEHQLYAEAVAMVLNTHDDSL